MIHYLQALSSPRLQNFGRDLALAAQDVVTSSWPNAAEMTPAIQRYRSLQGALAARDASGLGCLDLLESTAYLEAWKTKFINGPALSPRLAPVYLSDRDARFSDVDSPYRRGYDWLANRIGSAAAYECLAPMSFLAFLTPDPVSAMHSIVRLAKPYLEELRLAAVSTWIEQFMDGEFFLNQLGQSPRDAPPLWIAAEDAVRRLDLGKIVDVCARPATFALQLSEKEAEPLRPPIVLRSARDGEFQIDYNGIAWRDKKFARRIFDLADLVGIAERLAKPTGAGPHKVCRHVRCPHFASNLCNLHYLSPDLNRSHQECDFPAVFEAYVGAGPERVWAAIAGSSQ
jgi:hypothetical protein